jgi:hypothetical protein
MFNKILKLLSILLLIFLLLSFIPSIIFRKKFSNFISENDIKTKINSFSDTPNWNQYPIVSSVEMNRILIVTEARSGSTFLG